MTEYAVIPVEQGLEWIRLLAQDDHDDIKKIMIAMGATLARPDRLIRYIKIREPTKHTSKALQDAMLSAKGSKFKELAIAFSFSNGAGQCDPLLIEVALADSPLGKRLLNEDKAMLDAAAEAQGRFMAEHRANTAATVCFEREAKSVYAIRNLFDSTGYVAKDISDKDLEDMSRVLSATNYAETLQPNELNVNQRLWLLELLYGAPKGKARIILENTEEIKSSRLASVPGLGQYPKLQHLIADGPEKFNEIPTDVATLRVLEKANTYSAYGAEACLDYLKENVQFSDAIYSSIKNRTGGDPHQMLNNMIFLISNGCGQAAVMSGAEDQNAQAARMAAEAALIEAKQRERIADKADQSRERIAKINADVEKDKQKTAKEIAVIQAGANATSAKFQTAVDKHQATVAAEIEKVKIRAESAAKKRRVDDAPPEEPREEPRAIPEKQISYRYDNGNPKRPSEILAIMLINAGLLPEAEAAAFVDTNTAVLRTGDEFPKDAVTLDVMYTDINYCVRGCKCPALHNTYMMTPLKELLWRAMFEKSCALEPTIHYRDVLKISYIEGKFTNTASALIVWHEFFRTPTLVSTKVAHRTKANNGGPNGIWNVSYIKLQPGKVWEKCPTAASMHAVKIFWLTKGQVRQLAFRQVYGTL